MRLVQHLPLQGEHALSARLQAADLCLRHAAAGCARELLAPLAATAPDLPYLQARSLGLAQARLALQEGATKQAIAVAQLWHDRARRAGDLPTLLEALWVRGRAERRAGLSNVAHRSLQELIVGAQQLGQLQTYPFHRQQLLARARDAFALQLELRPPAAEETLSRSELPLLLWLLAGKRPLVGTPTPAVRAAQVRLNLLMQQHWQLGAEAVAGSAAEPWLLAPASLVPMPRAVCRCLRRSRGRAPGMGSWPPMRCTGGSSAAAVSCTGALRSHLHDCSACAMT